MKIPYQTLVWLCLICTPPIQAKVLDYEQLAHELGIPVVGACMADESWGASIFLLDGERGIRHYIQHRDPKQIQQPLGEQQVRYQEVRFIATDSNVTLCAVAGEALVFVDPAHGVYQTDRSIESDGEQLWLAATPVHYSDLSRFEMMGDELFLVTGRLRDQVLVDVAVRNDHVPELQPSEQLNVPLPVQIIGAPVSVGAASMVIAINDQSYLLNLDTQLFEPLVGIGANSVMAEAETYQVVASLLPELLSVKQIQSQGTSVDIGLVRDNDAQGLCLGDATLVSFDRDGQLRRYELSQTVVELVGDFQLSREVVSCLVDAKKRRLLVVEKEVGIWVFDLTDTGLSMPRAVTSDKMIESLNGLALYEQGDAGYILSQSVGDGTFLVFDRNSMQLVGRFRIGVNFTAGVDGVLASRGFAATAMSFANYPAGLMVVHDQRNRMPEAGENLKILDWRLVQRLLDSTIEKKNRESDT